MKPGFAPTFLWELFQQIRRRGFPLGIEDYDDLRRSVRLGYGIDSHQALAELCCALWAKSHQDRDVIQALLQRVCENNNISDWQADVHNKRSVDVETTVSDPVQEPTVPHSEKLSDDPVEEMPEPVSVNEEQTVIEPRRGLPEITLPKIDLKSHFVFVPQYPLNYRNVVQAWRRLRRPIRRGPPIDLDIQETIRRYADTGIAAGAVLTPRRVNTARLLIFEDRLGSMTPFHDFVTDVCHAIKKSANFDLARHYYFHDTPVHGTDINVLGELRDQLFPKLDSILTKIQPIKEGAIYQDPSLYQPIPISDVLDRYATGTAIIVISDAGAARRNMDILRLLDTIALLKTLYQYTRRVVWLNPLPVTNWAGTLAEQISRHIPMLPLDIYGNHRAVNVLRGQPFLLERSL